MDSNKLNFYFEPFKNIDDCFKAIHIFLRMSDSCHSEEILQCINRATKSHLVIRDYDLFIQKLTFFNEFYPIAFLKNFKEFNNELNDYLEANSLPSISVLSSVSSCLRCHSSGFSLRKYQCSVYFSSGPIGKT